MGSSLGACGDVNRNVMGPAAPFVNKPEYMLAQQYANDIADLLAPQSGAYYDVWLDGEKFVSVYKEVSISRFPCTCSVARHSRLHSVAGKSCNRVHACQFLAAACS